MGLLRSSLFSSLAKPALVLFLAVGALIQGMPLHHGMMAAVAEESKSKPNHENDDESESPIRTHDAVAQTFQRRIIQVNGRTSEFVRPRMRSTYAERSSHARRQLSFGTGIRAVPLRC